MKKMLLVTVTVTRDGHMMTVHIFSCNFCIHIMKRRNFNYFSEILKIEKVLHERREKFLVKNSLYFRTSTRFSIFCCNKGFLSIQWLQWKMFHICQNYAIFDTFKLVRMISFLIVASFFDSTVSEYISHKSYYFHTIARLYCLMTDDIVI